MRRLGPTGLTVLVGCAPVAPAAVEASPPPPVTAPAPPAPGAPVEAPLPAAPPGWVAFEGGTFTLGAPARWQADNPAAYGEHEVTLPPFMLARDQVTVAEWEACVREGACTALLRREECGGAPDLPANCVSYAQADAYCASIGARLPTEDEWERAARGGTERTFAWGDTWKDEAASQGRHPVGSHRASHTPEGLHDMAGNGREWTATSTSAGTHVTRGIECPYELSCPTFNRFPAEDDRSQHDYVGVRCARDFGSTARSEEATKPAAPPLPRGRQGVREVHWSTMSYEPAETLPPSLAALPRIVCVVEATIDPDGRVHDVRSTALPRLGIAHCPPGLARLAEDAVRRGEVEPFADTVRAKLPVFLGDPGKNMTPELDAKVFAPATPTGVVASPRAEGAPAPGCTVEVTVRPDGAPQVGAVYHCAGRYHDAARRAAQAWRWRAHPTARTGTIRVLFE